MKRLVSASVISLSLVIAGCSGESEETPDIAEAIPLNPEGSETEDGTDGSSGSEGTTASGSETPNLPDTMESGANPPGMTEPPAGSKVQRIEG